MLKLLPARTVKRRAIPTAIITITITITAITITITVIMHWVT
jgi:hypothetical protein